MWVSPVAQAFTLSNMNFNRLPPDPTRASGDAWAQTCPSELPAPAPRRQPPLREVLQGLDSRELEGPTVFDQLFGARPDLPTQVPTQAARLAPNHHPKGRTPNKY